jgi:hypothetical protein
MKKKSGSLFFFLPKKIVIAEPNPYDLKEPYAVKYILAAYLSSEKSGWS